MLSFSTARNKLISFVLDHHFLFKAPFFHIIVETRVRQRNNAIKPVLGWPGQSGLREVPLYLTDLTTSETMALLRLIWLLVLASCQRLESPDVDCKEGLACKRTSDCPFYQERREHLDSLSGPEYDSLLAALKDMVCNKAERGVCCRESFELVNGNIVESVEEMPFIVRLRLKTGFASWSICGASIIASQFLLTAKHCLFDFDQCIDERDCVAHFRDLKVSGWAAHEIGQFHIPIVDIFERKGLSDLVVVKLKHRVEEHEDYSLGATLKPIQLAKEAPKAGEVILLGLGGLTANFWNPSLSVKSMCRITVIW